MVEGGGARQDGGALMVARLHSHFVGLALPQPFNEQLRGGCIVLVSLPVTLDTPEHTVGRK